MEPMISARGLRKSFRTKDGPFEAVRGIDVEVRRGEAFGFLGPNGAGKSSTMRMVAAVSPPTAGELRILGLDPATHGPDTRARLGVCPPQDDTLDLELNVFDNLYIHGRYVGIGRKELRERCEQLLEFVQLTEKRRSKVDDLSGGMRRRLTIARSLVNSPELRFAPDLVEEHDRLAEVVADLAERVEVLPDRLLLYTGDGEQALAAVHERGLRPVTTLVRRSSLEDVFLRRTGRQLVD